jgi:Kyakuja-Dileera-Zisupton transposase
MFFFQVKYGVTRANLFGLCDGEGMERLWSYLRPFSRITKEMTPSHRIDLLTDALLHYAQRKKNTIGEIYSRFFCRVTVGCR